MSSTIISVYDWVWLWLQTLSWSLFSVGGAISVMSDMHRYLID